MLLLFINARFTLALHYKDALFSQMTIRKHNMYLKYVSFINLGFNQILFYIHANIQHIILHIIHYTFLSLIQEERFLISSIFISYCIR